MRRTGMGKWTLLAMLCALLAGCGADSAANVPPTQTQAAAVKPSSKSSEPGSSTSITIRSPMTLSNNLLPGTLRKDLYLRLQLVRGTYSENWAPGAYRGTLYEGYFQLVIADSEGRILSATPLDKLFPDPLIFNRHFSLTFDDYNNDGLPDFTLGQRADSNGGFYKMLTFAEDLTIRELPVRGSEFLYISKGEEGGSSYSVKLRKPKAGFVTFSSYNRDQGNYSDETYQWKNGEFLLVP
ncbi:hypothetical protein E5161_07770 [Cohnella pontilimi]|uniref:Lipoprotein n=1 Tax=Cohnella pontilimi TaxID=2564100 RepID=A0A4U0FD96_9BACL|nr:hypothetical protein [Cohnella pontilimi]TJY42731.1 hypothetical protein E5161_07770 [Cohnella pontilimi]